MTGILELLKWEPLKNRSRDSRFILLYKGLKGKLKPVYQQMTLFPWLDAAGIIILCHIRYQLPILIFKSMDWNLLSPLLRAPRIELLTLLLW